MAFPQTPLAIKAEFYLNGAWVDVTSRVRLENDVVITRGASSEQFALSAQQCQFTLNNRDGLYSNRNPNSIYYGKIGRNTPFRIGVTGTGTFLALPGWRAASIRTADKAVLDITGDIDIRADFRMEPNTWLVGNRQSFVLAAKYRFTASNNRSWFLAVSEQGYLQYRWSTNGTAFTTVTSTAAIAAATLNSRMAVRVTHDVDNGAAGNTVTFYTSDTIAGTWTALGSAVVTAGTTSIFSSSADLEVGSYDDDLSDPVNGIGVPPCRYYAMELRSGIAGTLVAKMDATAQAAGAVSWSDGLGTPNTWTCSGEAFVTATDYRFWGQLPKLPTKWDTSGRDIYMPVTGSSYLQQLTQGNKPLKSAMFRYVTRELTSIEGYWPFEDGSNAEMAAAGVTGGQAAAVNNVSFGVASDLAASAGTCTIDGTTSYIKGFCTNLGTGGSAENFMILFKYPAALGAEVVLATIYTTGTVTRWEVRVTTTGFRLVAKDGDGTSVLDATTAYGAGISPTAWLGIQLKVTVSGGTITGTLSWYNVSTVSSGFYADAVSGSFAGSLGRFKSFTITNSGGGQTGLQVAHAVITRQSAPMVAGSNVFHAATAWATEYAGQRWDRLLTEESIPHLVIGAKGNAFGSILGDSQQMGPQSVARLVDLLQECADADRAMMFERRNWFGLVLRLRRALHNQISPTLDYSTAVFSNELTPTPDDSTIRNDVTVSRPLGASAQATRTVGPLNTSRPTVDPQGVGTYDVPLTRNVYQDSQLPFLAQYEVQLGTIDQDRYPSVQVNLARNVFVASSTLTTAASGLDVGNPFTITNLPAGLPPDAIELLILGITERLQNKGWVIDWNTAPYDPYRVIDMTASTLARSRMASGDLSGSYTTLAADITSSATSFTVTGTGKLWGTAGGNFPLDIMIGGERITLSAISGASYPQTFTVSARSVNGVVKAHVTGDKVQIADIGYMTLGAR